LNRRITVLQVPPWDTLPFPDFHLFHTHYLFCGIFHGRVFPILGVRMLMATIQKLYNKKEKNMILQYTDLFDEKKKIHRIKAKITTEHSASHYGQPVIVLDDGGALDLFSWVSLGYQVIKASKKEQQALRQMGLI